MGHGKPARSKQLLLQQKKLVDPLVEFFHSGYVQLQQLYKLTLCTQAEIGVSIVTIFKCKQVVMK